MPVSSALLHPGKKSLTCMRAARCRNVTRCSLAHRPSSAARSVRRVVPGHAASTAADRLGSSRVRSAADLTADFGGYDGGSGDGKGKPPTARSDNNDESSGEGEDKILSLAEVEALLAKMGVTIPADMLQGAAKYGLRLSMLMRYLKMKDLPFTGALMQAVPWVRDRLLADHRFLFKVVAECLIDTGCATVAEVRKRGDEFWHEFEFYLSDLIVGIVLDVALVSLMAPIAVLGGVSKVAQASGPIQKWLASVPSAVFEAGMPGVRDFTLRSRLACLAVKFCEYSLAGIACGFVGQGVANGLMLLKRQINGASEHDVPVPPLVMTALTWGLFMGVSSNLRYQAVFGLERLVDMTIAQKIPQVAYATTIGIRFVNNIIGGENFIDMARWTGVQ